MQSFQMAIVRLVERLTTEQIRLLEELRELRDAGILTIGEFDSEVAKVLGRSQIVDDSAPATKSVGDDESSIVVEGSEEELLAQQNDIPDLVLAPDSTPDSGLLEYVFVHEQVVRVVESPVADGERSEAPTGEVSSNSVIIESVGIRQSSGRKKAFAGAMAGFLLLVVVALVVITGGEASVSTPTSNVEVTVTQSTPVATTQGSMSSVMTSTTTGNTIAPTTTYEILDCPYERTVEAVDNIIVFQEGVTVSVIPGPVLHRWSRERNGYEFVGGFSDGKTGAVLEQGSVIHIDNETNFRLWISIDGAVVLDDATHFFTIPKWLGPTAGYIDSDWAPGRYLTVDDEPSEMGRYEIFRATFKFACP